MRGISKIAVMGCAALVLVSVAGAAHADDPRDPTMRSTTARARDAAQIRKLNQDQLAYVSQRDAGYQQQWSDYRRYHESDAEHATAYAAPARDATGHDSAQDEYARARSDYAASLAQWRRDVDACRNGNYDRCAN